MDPHYTGQYYTHLLVLAQCKDYNDYKNIPYHYRQARHICDPNHIAWFHSQLELEDKQNEEIKLKIGEYDPQYEKHQIQLKTIMKTMKVKNKKELLMKLYQQFGTKSK